ncbi:methionyl-tRNA formyltransferase [Meiothermus granaticius]|uniref:methionyl-tRNA formyltransferase n=1 Tax=Meiothermus granaticius TaxID=863370 RepID=UPI001194BE00|nr:methionyl-tRNA formyltransferase [Meiothermus granaticius]GEM87484.1 methionyl-tRNA formyltransferase [Meiothermus granaticius NBRC 107808]
MSALPGSSSRGRRVAFFGSPAWSIPVLEALHRHHQVVLVVTQPDKPVGRGLRITPCPVAAWAEAQGLRVEKPARLRKNPEFLALFKNLGLEVAITAAYGKILPAELLELPRFGFLNLHPSDLPKYRGPAPVQWTLINGDAETAVCIMQTDVGMDTGPVVARWSTPVGPDETALELSNRLRDKGIELLLEALEGLEHLHPTPQPPTGSHAPLLAKEDGKILWERTAAEIYNRHRGVQPWPGSWFEHQGKRVKVLKMSRAEGQTPNAAPGTVVGVADGLEVSTAQGNIGLKEVQPEGKKPMSALEWARGARIAPGDRL